ncbi:Oidioi.mRNA.OKI2018_I69.PAR.g12468.t1.cds [Oikopleura dioica]|uniref:Protein-serine/threonine kinase n=1 Tax=Oikopleura dioica TaxID=34765 RepID=A0ABN7S064_OIKDI|nr:Oidioi.mRNA.OKI2018_I69.PAR.g12468.t1.cds [Oikopleura dioica]
MASNLRVFARRLGSGTVNKPIYLQEKYSNFVPRPLSADDLLLFADKNSVEKSFEFLKQELPTRWMQTFAEINALPIEKPSPLMLEVKNMIQETLENLLPFADQPATENVISKFNSKLEDYIHRHRTAVDEVALAILEFKDEQLEMAEKGLTTFDLDDAEEKVHYFLDRYFTTLVSTNLIIHQHLLILGMNSDRQKRETVQRTNVTKEIRKIALKIETECKKYYGKSPSVKITEFDMGKATNDSQINTIFIPSHLEQICAELIRNAVRATVENNPDLPPVEIIISRANDNVTIKISDKGKGASLREQAKWGAYLYTKPPEQSTSKMPLVEPLAGYGYGIPLAAVYARYLGGDVVIQSLQNYGTDVVIYLPSNAKDLIEVLPVFTAKTKEYYNSQSRKKTWITGKSSEKGDIVFDS